LLGEPLPSAEPVYRNPGYTVYRLDEQPGEQVDGSRALFELQPAEEGSTVSDLDAD
jgi:hypothetical protein